MVKFLNQHAKWIIAVFGFLVFGVTATSWLKSLPLWQWPEGVSIDLRYAFRGARFPDPQIKLVGLENGSFQLDTLSSNEIAASPALQLMQQPWPWDRRVYAAILEKLINAGAKVVAFDFVFASQTEGDDDFALALQKHRDRVVIGEMIQDEKEESQFKGKELIAPNPRLLLPGTESIVGLVNQWPDHYQVIRSVKYHTSLEQEKLSDPNLDPRVAEVLRSMIQKGEAPELTHFTAVAVKKYTGEDLSPPDGDLHYIDFQGSGGTYRPFPVEDLFVDELWKAPPFNNGLVFSNKIVIVGPIAEIFHDVHTTPLGEMPGPELQAQIMAALLQHSWLRGTAPAVDSVLSLLMLGLGLGICLRIRNAVWKTLLLGTAVMAYFLICQLAFNHSKLVLPVLQPFCCLAVPGAFGIVFQFALEQIERRRTRVALDRLVSDNVAKLILDDQRGFEEKKKRRKQAVTVLFSVIRGFTSMTESSDGRKLVAQLNEYFLEMGGVIREQNGGTLSKYIGDAIMAVWGDTHSEGVVEDTRRAVSAALGMRAALTQLNERWAANPDRMKWKTGIGVNHGEVIVGEMGHPKRAEFTVIGDGVNLAARLESSTKQFHTDILVGEEAEKLTRDHFIYRSVGAIAFKGKTKPIEVFMLLGDRSQPAPAWLAKYHEAVRLYRSRQFEAAAAAFEQVEAEMGGEDYLCRMYLELCASLREQAPGPAWNGSFTLTEK